MTNILIFSFNFNACVNFSFVIEKNLNTNIFGIGVFSITKEKLTQALKLNEKIKIFVIGLVIMDKKITANLIDKAVEKVRIFGVIKAPKEVKKAMERKR
jgi:hypothetical protein